jgi:hypothetical protein
MASMETFVCGYAMNIESAARVNVCKIGKKNKLDSEQLPFVVL